MKIAYITAGAAGMYCGSCMHDNTLASSLMALGHDVVLVPTYTPIRTDEADVSQKRVFLGGINVFLQQKFALFRHTPRLFDRWLDAPGLLRWVSRFAVGTQANQLGELALSVLRGEHGHQRKEFSRLVHWLATDIKPQIVNLTNVLLAGIVGELKQRLGVPVLATLQGDDIFLEALPEKHRAEALSLIREHCRHVDGFIATSRYYADFMAGYLGIPRERIEVVYPGLNLAGYGAARPQRNGEPFTIGYFARICPEKGLHILAEAFMQLCSRAPDLDCRLHVSGWLGDHNRGYFDAVKKRLHDAGLAGRFRHVESPDHAGKVRFLQEIDVLSVPTVYREPKGLYVLEALASSVPVVQPRHGSFPELVEITGGGVLAKPEDPADLARALEELARNEALRRELASKGQAAVRERFAADVMARATLDVYHKATVSDLRPQR
ncbi:MAG: glycosyltransferase family 4 protein [Planctomycetes bacterium]|nr:glycosyltransferase family 4 protein [Planctomycetota bacterium]